MVRHSRHHSMPSHLHRSSIRIQSPCRTRVDENEEENESRSHQSLHPSANGHVQGPHLHCQRSRNWMMTRTMMTTLVRKENVASHPHHAVQRPQCSIVWMSRFCWCHHRHRSCLQQLSLLSLSAYPARPHHSLIRPMNYHHRYWSHHPWRKSRKTKRGMR